MDFIEQFRAAMAQDGIICECEIIADGKLHRFHVRGDSSDKNNGWYVLHATELPAGAYGCWKRCVSQTWCLKSKDQMTPVERENHYSRMQQIRATAEAAKTAAQAKAKSIAKARWDTAKPASPNHPYLLKKGIGQGLLRVEESTNTLLVPVCGPDKQIHSLQQISADGKDKRFLGDGATKGHYCSIGKLANPTDTLYVAEGYATAATIHDATGCATACAFYCGNLLAVGQVLRTKFPEAELMFIADNDQWSTDGSNVGITKATEAAEALGTKMFYPDFTGLDTRDKPTDFNDLARLAGLDEVKRQLTPVPLSPPHTPSEPIAHSRHRINEDAFFGILKDFVDASRTNSEASAVAVAATVIAFFCAMVGRKAYQWIGDSIIHCRPFFLLIGNSSKARKGTSTGLPKRVFETAENMLETRKKDHSRLRLHGGGLSSGEGVAHAIRDASDDPKNSDPGIADKRLLVIESEFANVLVQCKRESSILSVTIRNLFDGLTLAPLTKTNRVQATKPHVVIIGQITQQELHARSSIIEATNGFLNRFLICSIERDQLVALPQKTSDQKIEELAEKVLDIMQFIDAAATKEGIEIQLSEAARSIWTAIYPTLTEERPGIVGALMGRSEMYARMLAMIFCLLDKKTIIEVTHLETALSWINYVEESIEYVFGEPLEQKKQHDMQRIADRIIVYIKKHGAMTKTEINNAFGGHILAEKLDEALHQLLHANPPTITRRTEETKGKRREIFELWAAD